MLARAALGVDEVVAGFEGADKARNEGGRVLEVAV